jgi:hypothetical protein
VGNSIAPVLCQFPQDTHIVTIAAGSAHSLALESRSFLFGLEAVLDLTLATAEAKILPQNLSGAPIDVEIQQPARGDEGHHKAFTCRLSDGGGHSLVVVFTREEQQRSVIMELRSLQYNGSPAISPIPNRVEYEIRANKAGAMDSLRQHLVMHSAAARLEITAHYAADRDETSIHVSSGKVSQKDWTRRGLVLIRLGTMSGSIGFSDGIETWSL